ncbi:unnamed protein product [Miscanthus lutarioriparius]|uniref:Tetrahydrofolate dehydrogenase/cyclohydrolase catalytic domain-containing protein n=1 Tax=Miscanthus lutarioriparius TaxID=422564 RepID=A0A811S0T3_9POAL|nr:unnamed protein product [Miscanthus lutarioriparius]
MAQIIDGEGIAADIRREVPGLAVLIVGSWKDSRTYADMKCNACGDVGIRSVLVDLPEDTSEAALVAEVHRLNADPAVHGLDEVGSEETE